MTDARNHPGYIVTGLLLLIVGLGVFAVRLDHAGPYAMPHTSALYGAIGLLVISGVFLWPKKPRVLGWIAIVASPIALFPAIYSIVGESEEVISIYAADAKGQTADLRLWIVDREDGAWVGMPRWKAVDYSLHGAELQMLRAGELVCVKPVLFEDEPTTRTIHAMKYEKYLAAQMAGAIGLYPREATESTVVLRLDPC